MVSALWVFCCTMLAVRARQSMSASRRLMMSHARSPVVTASKVMAASRAGIAGVAHACTIRPSASSDSSGRIRWERLMPANPTASTRSLRPVNFKNGRKFDTSPNSEDRAHVPASESRKPSTLDPSASRRRRIPRDSRNTR